MVKGLSDNQKTKLWNRKKMSPQTRANFDYKMARKLRSRFDGLIGLDLILECIPSEKIRAGEYITDKHVVALFKLTEAVLKALEYKKVRGTTCNLYVIRESVKKTQTGIDFRTGRPRMVGISRRAKPTKQDFDRAIKLNKHLYALGAFVDPDVPIKGYEMPAQYPCDDDFDDAVIQANEDLEAERKIGSLLSEGVSDIEQIAKEAHCPLIMVENFIERQRKIKELKEAKANLEQDLAAIQKIKELWAEGWINRTEIAKAIGHPRDAVCTVINQMIANGEIPKDLVIIPGRGGSK